MAIKKLNAKISKIENMSPTVRAFTLELGEALDYKSGQFINLSFKSGDEIIRRPYSLSSTPDGNSKLELCIKLVEGGQFTTKLWEKEEGDIVGVMGPLGIFNLEKSTSDNLVFIGTGTGIAPLRGMINDLIKNESKKQITLIFGVRKEEEILFKTEFETLEKNNPNFKFLPIVSRGTDSWAGRSGHVQDNFDTIDPLNSEFFICGLPAMYDSTKAKLLELGTNEKNIFHEVFR